MNGKQALKEDELLEKSERFRHCRHNHLEKFYDLAERQILTLHICTGAPYIGADTLNQGLLNILTCLDCARDCGYVERGEVVDLLLEAIAGRKLFHGPLGQIVDTNFDMQPFTEKLHDLRTELNDFYEPLSKFYDIERSFKDKPVSKDINEAGYETLPEDTRFVIDTAECKELVNELAEI